GEDDDLLIAARKGSPLILGVGDNEYFVASDAAPLVEHTRQVVYLNDGEMVVVRRSGYEVKTIDNTPLEKEIPSASGTSSRTRRAGSSTSCSKRSLRSRRTSKTAFAAASDWRRTRSSSEG